MAKLGKNKRRIEEDDEDDWEDEADDMETDEEMDPEDAEVGMGDEYSPISSRP